MARESVIECVPVNMNPSLETTDVFVDAVITHEERVKNNKIAIMCNRPDGADVIAKVPLFLSVVDLN